MGKKVLFHACCGPCSLAAIKRLKDLGLEPIGYFYNPNIWPYEEYNKRLKGFVKVAKFFNISYYVKDYSIEEYEREHLSWRTELWNKLGNLAEYKEGSLRCEYCIRYRLKEAFEFAKQNNIAYVTTSLTLGPTKDIEMINRIGIKLSKEYKINYLPEAFRKHKGWNYSVKMSKELQLYRQDYCGCEYSLIERKMQVKKRAKFERITKNI